MRAAVFAAMLSVVAGCRAQVDAPTDMAGDGSVPEDLGDGPPDLVGADFACPPMAAEVCGNGCDDDRNGYFDADDPACSTQLLVTPQTTMGIRLQRLVLGPTLALSDVSPAQFTGVGSGTLAGTFAPAGFLAVDGTGNTVHRVPLSGAAPTAFVTSFTTRDVCVFNGELIVVERAATSRLHRLQGDGKTELGVVSLGAIVATACASDGDRLYVAVHDTVPNPSLFVVFDKTFTAVTGSPLPMPPSLLTAGFDRCLDLAWAKSPGAFYGLFVNSFDAPMGPLNDTFMSAKEIFPFAFDGGVGVSIDAGGVYGDAGLGLHGLGEFLP